MDYTIDERIRTIWGQLEDESGDVAFIPKRKYRRLEIGKETGIRLSCYLPDRSWELLIEIEAEKDAHDLSFPDWRGMAFDIIQLDLPVPNTYHICLRMQHSEYKEVFLSVCSDLARELQSVGSVIERKRALIDFLDRWSRFFERHGLIGLPSERQRGLFGELWWLRRLLGRGIDCHEAVHSWKGCEREYHDFEIQGHVVEVKTTLSKDPAKVIINNERQLDSRGLVSLHLLALSLYQAQSGGESLQGIVSSIREILSHDILSSRRFEYSCREAGYLDNQACLYDATYTVRKEELFSIHEGFPRITDVPSGIGDLRYSLVLAACKEYIADSNEYIDALTKRGTE